MTKVLPQDWNQVFGFVGNPHIYGNKFFFLDLTFHEYITRSLPEVYFLFSLIMAKGFLRCLRNFLQILVFPFLSRIPFIAIPLRPSTSQLAEGFVGDPEGFEVGNSRTWNL